MTTLNFFEARRHLGATLDRVTTDGDRFVLARRGKPLAVLVSSDDLTRLQEMEDVDDLRAARAALTEHTRNPSTAVTVAEYRARRKTRP